MLRSTALRNSAWIKLFFVVWLAGSIPAKAQQGNTERKSPDIVVYAAGDIADCRRVPPEQTGAAETAALIENELAGNKHA
ncbi:MAG: hypothetical protein ACO1NO_08455, partial [Burkholderiaceae bacterium]